MPTNGLELLVAVQQVRHFFREVAGLLATADGMMAEYGWDRRAANTAVSDMSASLQFPERWMPYLAFRFYQQKQARHLLPSIAVVLDSEAEDAGLVPEPLVVATLFDFGPGTSVSNTYYAYNYSGFYTRLPERKDNGTAVSVDPRVAFPDARCVAQNMAAFGLPLVQIGSSSALKEMIVMPLVTLIVANMGSAVAGGSAVTITGHAAPEGAALGPADPK